MLLSTRDRAGLVQLINAVTTNKTDFFREPEHFQFVSEVVLPELDDTYRSGAGISVWSAACSSGEEPYSLAMILSEHAERRLGFRFRILGTDVSTSVLETAREGIYSIERAGPVPVALRRKYLLSGRGSHASDVRITPALRRLVGFHRLNLMSTDYGVREMFHIIFLRNVLIYFDRPVQEAVINRLWRNLRPGGYFFISHSESLSGLNVPLAALSSSCFRKEG